MYNSWEESKREGEKEDVDIICKDRINKISWNFPA